jgi:F420-non-reducing hydrogenase iron-sulfur subunit
MRWRSAPKDRSMGHDDIRIIAFLCNWCSYDAADAAGRQTRTYPAGVRIIRLMCSGRLDPQMVLEAFGKGAQGVLVLGCRKNDCHYKTGNLQALKRVIVLKRLLPSLGIEPQQLHMEWISAGEGEAFARIAGDMAERIAHLQSKSRQEKTIAHET